MISYPNSKPFHSKRDVKKVMDWKFKAFLLVVFFTAFPLFDVPGIGISITAPLVYLITIDLFLRPSRIGYSVRSGISCLAVLAGGIFISSLVTGLSDKEYGFNKTDFIFLVRYTYWLLTAFVTIKLVSKYPEIGEKIVRYSVWGTFCLVLCRWFEGVVWGKVGAWTDLRIISQNNYAFVFSTFGPMFISIFLMSKGRKKLFYGLMTVALWGAIFINGSRSGWITVSLAIIGFIGMRFIVSPFSVKTIARILIAIIVIIIISFISFKYMPQTAKESFMSRFSTMEDLDTDKSYQIRVLMRQKAMKIFKEHPVFGCGPARFKKTEVYLDIPKVLSYGGQETFMYRSAHNSFMQFLAETGFVGNVPFYFFIIFLALKGFHASVQLARINVNWPMGIYISFLTMSVHMWTISGLTNTHVWMMYGLVAAIIPLPRALRRANERVGGRAL